jgi:ABC-type transport system involved in multi-copper enzyme maturation permease subunit
MRWLIEKDARELLASRAFWLLMLVVGLLAGHAFLTATATYAELSGAAGGTPALAQGLNPLDGIVRPIFGAYTLAEVLLLPFVAIRLIASERQSGAMRLLLQAPVSRARVVASKVIVLKLAWILAMLPGFIALGMWRLAGGHLYWPEVLAVILGHILVALIAVGVALAAGALAGSPASAAILALTFTLGTWAIDFAARVQGGWIAFVAGFTPSVVLRTFDHGELRASSFLIALVVTITGAAIAAIWLDVGESMRRKLLATAGVMTVATIAGGVSGVLRPSADVSEDRRTSFPESSERALRSIGKPISLTVHLGAEDPRRVDLEHEILAKLRRVVDIDVRYAGASNTGLTSRDEHYGEMVYAIGDRADTTRSVIEEVVLETIYKLAGVTPPAASPTEAVYPGYPLDRVPVGIGLVFFLLWPAVVLAGWVATRRMI